MEAGVRHLPSTERYICLDVYKKRQTISADNIGIRTEDVNGSIDDGREDIG